MKAQIQSSLIYMVFCRKANDFDIINFVEKIDADIFKKLKLNEYDEITIHEADLYW